MNTGVNIKRTGSNDPDFQLLASHLDHELWNELQEDQATYDQYNKVPDIKTAVVLYVDNKPVAIGCFKEYNKVTVEIKRMFVEKWYRGQGFSIVVLDELEKWARELNFRYAILETSVHFQAAKALYTGAGYHIIENYDQYKGLEESVCMKKKLFEVSIPIELRDLDGIEYFSFEEDFVEKNIRCIPMIVRFKMDKAGIKLKLNEWTRFTVGERIQLASMPCESENEARQYHEYLRSLVKKHTNKDATLLEVNGYPEWRLQYSIPVEVRQRLVDENSDMSVEQWRDLTRLQRFALVKLSRPGHESKNFIKATREFGITQ